MKVKKVRNINMLEMIKKNKRQEDALANLRRQIPDDENKKKTRIIYLKEFFLLVQIKLTQ